MPPKIIFCQSALAKLLALAYVTLDISLHTVWIVSMVENWRYQRRLHLVRHLTFFYRRATQRTKEQRVCQSQENDSYIWIRLFSSHRLFFLANTDTLLCFVFAENLNKIFRGVRLRAVAISEVNCQTKPKLNLPQAAKQDVFPPPMLIIFYL